MGIITARPTTAYFAVIATACFCNVLILWLAFKYTYSNSGFILLGGGTCLLIDRYLFQLLPWPFSTGRASGLALRIGYFLIGMAGIALAGGGMFPLREVILLGFVFSLVAFLFELVLGQATRLASQFRNREGKSLSSRWTVFWLALILLAPVVAFMPLAATHPLKQVPNFTPAAFGLDFEEVLIPTADGLELGGWLVTHLQARGSVVFCHGHGSNRGHLAPYAARVYPLGVNTLTFDFRGCGRSPGHTVTFGHREVEDVTAAVAYMHARFPQQPIAVVGVSYGAAVSLQALPQLPDIRAAWLDSCFTRLVNVADNRVGFIPDRIRPHLISAYSYLTWADGGYWGTDINPIEALDRIKIPLYFVHGRNDELVPFTEGQSLFERYAGPKWHYWVNDGTHFELMKYAGDEYFQRLEQFLKTQLLISASGPLRRVSD